MKNQRTIANEFVRNIAVTLIVAIVLIVVTHFFLGNGAWLATIVVLAALAAIIPASLYVKDVKQAEAARSRGPFG